MRRVKVITLKSNNRIDCHSDGFQSKICTINQVLDFIWLLIVYFGYLVVKMVSAKNAFENAQR